ncbi:putative threonine efflux protein [Desulfocapsa sulfexigens DSM 10523]|uniref:Putative threonine efflux protein n=1 Tax=Desulfocapsa sulfexigens (strain DSM 10523 / SB164P1) TaxID=1167006 RepID=M1P4P4_DESSD|nr:LysE family translocator [Desulfocapsa sulfexigens]AGF76672.1 putative threonine efflux protein [Desulfocapsa sulfexigens DSM 10523]
MSFFGVTDLWLFVVAGLLLNITPGADLLYITNRSAVQGRKAGVIAALGIGAGCVFHVVAAALGLSMILVSSSLAFTVVKYLGAAYLLYLGIGTFLTLKGQKQSENRVMAMLSLPKIFRQAVLINILNPKVALFFMALLPQFVSPTATHPALTFLFLGVVFNVNGTVVNVLFALFTSALAKRLQSISVLPIFLKSLVGVLFVSLGLRLAFLE